MITYIWFIYYLSKLIYLTYNKNYPKLFILDVLSYIIYKFSFLCSHLRHYLKSSWKKYEVLFRRMLNKTQKHIFTYILYIHTQDSELRTLFMENYYRFYYCTTSHSVKLKRVEISVLTKNRPTLGFQSLTIINFKYFFVTLWCQFIAYKTRLQGRR